MFIRLILKLNQIMIQTLCKKIHDSVLKGFLIPSYIESL